MSDKPNSADSEKLKRIREKARAIQNGTAGITPEGTIVDLAEHPEAFAYQGNGVPMPKDRDLKREALIEKMAKSLSKRVGHPTSLLEPGSICVQAWMSEKVLNNGDYDHLFDDGKIKPDGQVKDEAAHFLWRHYIFDAIAVLEIVEAEE